MKYLRLKDVIEKVGIKKSTVWARTKDVNDDFPSSKKLSPRVTVWVEEEIENWMKNENKKNG